MSETSGWFFFPPTNSDSCCLFLDLRSVYLTHKQPEGRCFILDGSYFIPVGCDVVLVNRLLPSLLSSMFVVSLLQNGTCRRDWVTQTEPAFRSVPLTYSNNINCVLRGQEACPPKKIQPPHLSARARPLGKQLCSSCFQVGKNRIWLFEVHI